MRNHKNTTQKHRAHLTLESLESRDMMSVTSAVLSAGTLKVVANDANDYIEIRQVKLKTGSQVTVKDRTMAANNVWSFNAASVQHIVVEMNGGNDKLDSNASAPTVASGGAGNDVIITGSGNDKLFGGSGTNQLFAGAGNDSLYAGSRADYVDGGTGYDYLELFSGQATAVNGESVKINVPTDQPQTDSWSCGPNSGSRYLRSYGINVSYSTLRSQIQEDAALSKFHLGTLPTNLRDLLKQYKSNVSLETGASCDRVLQLLAQGKPVIGLVAVDKIDIEKWGVKVGTYANLHYMVFNGFDQATGMIRFVDTNGATGTWTYDEFSKHSNWGDYFTGAGAGFAETLRVMGMRNQTILF